MRAPWILLLFLIASPALAQLDEAPEIDEETLFELALPRIEQLYLHPEAIDPAEMARAGIQAMEDIGPRLLVLETAPGELRVRVDTRAQSFRYDDVTDLVGLRHRLDEVVDFAVADTDDLDAEDLRVEALDGLLRTIDRHSRLIVGGRLDEFDTRYKGTLVGIGARIGRRAGFLRVLLPFAEAPAGRAGLQAMDIISHIDGQSTAAMSVEDAVDRIRGPEGVPVLLTIQRDGEEGRRVYVIVREKVLVPSVEHERLDGDIGYVVIDHFSQKTSEEFATHVEAMNAEGELRGIIIDLRGNTGGSMRQSARIVNAFIEEGVLIRTEGRGNKPVKRLTPRIVAVKKSKLFDGPVAVLMNSRTASGSEIVAGGLKFLERSITIGTQSFGKGTVQKVYPLRKTGRRASLKLTVARYLLPDDAYINSIGVTPDVVTGQVWLDPREPTLPDTFREPAANAGGVASNGGLDARKNPGNGRAVLDEGINAGAVLRLWYPRVLDGWAEQAGDDDASAAAELDRAIDLADSLEAVDLGCRALTARTRLDDGQSDGQLLAAACPEQPGALAEAGRLAASHDRCPLAVDLAKRAIAAGGDPLEIVGWIAPCGTPTEVESWLPAATPSLPDWGRAWLRNRLHPQREEVAVSASDDVLLRHLAAMARLSETQGSRFVVLSYPFPGVHHKNVRERLIEGQGGYALLDLYDHFEATFDEATWQAMRTPEDHVNARGYREMGEVLLRSVTSAD